MFLNKFMTVFSFTNYVFNVWTEVAAEESEEPIIIFYRSTIYDNNNT